MLIWTQCNLCAINVFTRRTNAFKNAKSCSIVLFSTSENCTYRCCAGDITYNITLLQPVPVVIIVIFVG